MKETVAARAETRIQAERSIGWTQNVFSTKGCLTRSLLTDAAGIASVLRDLVLDGKRHTRSDPEFALQHYLANPDRIECHIAADDQGMILGFQSLKLAVAGNPYGTPVGWAIIGTHVRPNSVRAGLGKALFSLTLKTAQSAGVPAIEAFIGAKIWTAKHTMMPWDLRITEEWKVRFASRYICTESSSLTFEASHMKSLLIPVGRRHGLPQD